MDRQSFTGLLNQIERSNCTLPNRADKWSPMLSQFEIGVQASSHSEADKRRLLEHTDDYISKYEFIK